MSSGRALASHATPAAAGRGAVMMDPSRRIVDPISVAVDCTPWAYTVGRVTEADPASGFEPGDHAVGMMPAATPIAVDSWRLTKVPASMRQSRLEFVPLVREAAALVHALSLPRDASVLVLGNDLLGRVAARWIAVHNLATVVDVQATETAQIQAAVLTSGDPADLLSVLPRIVTQGTALLAAPARGRTVSLHLYPDIHRREVRLVGFLRSFEREAPRAVGPQALPALDECLRFVHREAAYLDAILEPRA